MVKALKQTIMESLDLISGTLVGNESEMSLHSYLQEDGKK